MQKRHIGFELSIYEDVSALSIEDHALVERAGKARATAYSPYSKFQVGAAVLMADGTIVTGSNQENASFPAGLCAEGAALFHAGSNFPEQRILAIAVSASSQEYRLRSPAAPCGICRQAIAEYEQKQNAPIRIIMHAESTPIYICNAITDLLPLAFDSSFLHDSSS